jgi:ketosteroid isomerase-like protein
MDLAAARSFVAQWVTDWNAHDLDGLLGHFAEDVVFTSPAAAQLNASSGGVVRGKAALREYWTEGLRRIPDLHFEVVASYVGIDYRNQRGGLVNEVLVFDGALVVQGHGTYLDA